MFANLDETTFSTGLGVVLDRMLRPAVGFSHPRDVLKDPDLSCDEKRAVLSSWASDACAVPDYPTLRLMVGGEFPVPLQDILECLARLDTPDFAGDLARPPRNEPEAVRL